MKIFVVLVGLWTMLAAAQSCTGTASGSTGDCSVIFVTATSSLTVSTTTLGDQVAMKSSNGTTSADATPYSALPGVSAKSIKTVNSATLTQVDAAAATVAGSISTSTSASSTYSGSAAASAVPWSGAALALVGLIMASL